ncbi:hypothetical protein ES703_71828 [subsurface metagenome]
MPQENIYIGDPMCDIWNHLYDKFYAEFPDISYVSQGVVNGRYKLTKSTEDGIIYSDKGTVMTEITSHNFFVEMMEADYLLNIPSMKGHRWGGITLFAKNHFGSNTADHSWELHKGLMKPDDDPLREGYGLYRVMVDLMACQYLGGNTLLYYIDALWATSYEHQKPQKFQSAPFNNNWCSSVLFSMDPVAIESVCLDILQKEFTEEDLSANPPRYTYVQWDGVDDYLHQAASSDWWPESFTYDPDNTGSAIGSLGVHEHWNNTTDMKYSRNLETGEGIELVKLFAGINSVYATQVARNLTIYPNPCKGSTTISIELKEPTELYVEIYFSNGKLLSMKNMGGMSAGNNQITLDVSSLNPGLYYCTIHSVDVSGMHSYSEKLIIQ